MKDVKRSQKTSMNVCSLNLKKNRELCISGDGKGEGELCILKDLQ